VREAAATNANATEPVLMAAMEDEHPGVRLAAVKNPNATENVFKRAARDADERVRKADALSDKASTVSKIIGALGV